MTLREVQLILIGLMTAVLFIAWYKTDIDYDDNRPVRLKPGSKPWKWFKRRD